jgi:hypothetical protein
MEKIKRFFFLFQCLFLLFLFYEVLHHITVNLLTRLQRTCQHVQYDKSSLCIFSDDYFLSVFLKHFFYNK